MSRFQPQTYISHENGLKFDVDDQSVAQLLANPEKKAFLSLENQAKSGRKSGKSGKADCIDDADDLEQDVK